MSKFGICALSLGYTRTAGLTVYDSGTREFIEMKPKDAKRLIEAGMLHGVKYDGTKEKDFFVPDPEFNMQDLLIKSGVGNYRSMLHEVPGMPAMTAYVLVRVLETNVGPIYEIVNNRCQRVKLTEEQLRGLHNIGNIGGVFITDDEIRVCEGVVIENRVYPEDAQFVGLPLTAEGAVQAMMEENSGNTEETPAAEAVVEETPAAEKVEEPEKEEVGAEAEPEENTGEAPEVAEGAEVKEGSSLSEIFGENDKKPKASPKKKASKKAEKTEK